MMSKTWQWLKRNRKKLTEDSNSEKKIIDDAMEKAITPEIQLALHRATENNVDIFEMMMKYVSFLGVIALGIVLISMNYTFQAHFGEDNWDDMREAIPEENSESLESIGIVAQIFVLFVCVNILFKIYHSIRDIRRGSKLKKLILGRVAKMKETDK